MDNENHQSVRSLRARAAAAASRARLEEQLKRQQRDQERAEQCLRMIDRILGIPTMITGKETLPIEIDGLLFEADRNEYGWRLILIRPCVGECGGEHRKAILGLAELGLALEDGPDLCPDCDG